MSDGVAVPRRATCYITNLERKLTRLNAAFTIRGVSNSFLIGCGTR